jgi:hypothetical protein
VPCPLPCSSDVSATGVNIPQTKPGLAFGSPDWNQIPPSRLKKPFGSHSSCARGSSDRSTHRATWRSRAVGCHAQGLRRHRPRPGDKWHLDEVFIRIQGVQHYLWRAVDQRGVVLDILVQNRRDGKAAKRFFRRLLKGQGDAPRG